MKNYLSVGKIESFDEIHKKICVNLIEKCEERISMTYGQAQKIINMAFKYLYCCRHDSAMEERFKACHMPLDSFSLEWFKRNLGKMILQILRGILKTTKNYQKIYLPKKVKRRS